VRFEWDESKDCANIAKHGIGFDEARRVFSDPHVIVREDRVVEGRGAVARHRSCGPRSAGRPYSKGRGSGRDRPHRFSPQSDAYREEVV